jgi:hypothetical protein
MLVKFIFRFFFWITVEGIPGPPPRPEFFRQDKSKHDWEYKILAVGTICSKRTTV